MDFDAPPTAANVQAGNDVAKGRAARKRKARGQENNDGNGSEDAVCSANCFSSCIKHDLSCNTWVYITIEGEEKSKCDNCSLSVSDMQNNSKSAFQCANCPRLLCFDCVSNGFLEGWQRRGKMLKTDRDNIRANGGTWDRARKRELQNLEHQIMSINPCGLA